MKQSDTKKTFVYQKFWSRDYECICGGYLAISRVSLSPGYRVIEHHAARDLQCLDWVLSWQSFFTSGMKLSKTSVDV